jgi:hypothetical protein
MGPVRGTGNRCLTTCYPEGWLATGVTDFTYERYGELLDCGLEVGFPYLTARGFLDETERPEAFIMLRHDVDRRPENALEFARPHRRRERLGHGPNVV